MGVEQLNYVHVRVGVKRDNAEEKPVNWESSAKYWKKKWDSHPNQSRQEAVTASKIEALFGTRKNEKIVEGEGKLTKGHRNWRLPVMKETSNSRDTQNSQLSWYKNVERWILK